MTTALLSCFRLLDSLSRVDDIDSALLIISHDLVDSRMMSLTRSINFTSNLVTLIHPRHGHDEYTQTVAEDMRGITRLKLHWWWLVQEVFDHILINVNAPFRASDTRPRNDWVVFLEEDHIVSSDLLSTADGLRQLLHSQCPHCWGASLYSPDAYNPHSSSSSPATNLNQAFHRVRGAIGWQSTSYMIDTRFVNLLKQQQEKFKQCRDGW